ncbi:cytochrome P450 [Agrococcus jejuensis]|uniref:Cytochrome P450 n=1 Tax=Agrococcus jejuensis TaxID=399736 RepID=A0A1G8CDN7_9MICO|nr:cytochrome P450 [Agrococcus jejuensis]SDH43621.1 Cytochrome P450 [Agrococcus jejuensis]
MPTPPVADWVQIADLYRDPFPIYERLRAEGGVHWVPAVGRYLITTYDAVHATEVDQQTFSADEEGSLQIRAMGHSMLRRDDPEHYLERTAWQPTLRPGVVKRVWRSVFERNAARYLDEMVAKGPGEADLIWDFAAPFAAENLREMLGFHNVHQTDLQRWSQTLIDATGNYADDPEVWAKGKRSFDEVDAALDEMLAWHAKHPDHSLISQLIRIPDYRMPIERIRANIKMTIGGGLNEPRDALGVAAWAVLLHPEQRRMAEADASLWPTVFEETIRWISPIGLYSRQTTREVELAGVTLPEGARLGICILSANRDETVWDRPEAFDVRREVKPHLAFSKGVHVCLGNWAARSAVADVALPMLFDRLRGLSLVPERPAEVGGWVFRGMLSMPIGWDAVAPAGASVAVDAARDAAAPALAPRIAIVGSGPAGCFSAQALRRALPAAPLDVIDRLPVPYGLVRHGVAADHQGTKAVSRQFDRLFLHEGVRFVGGVQVDAAGLARLRSSYDAVVLATGLSADAALAIPGAALPGVVGAGAVTRLLNGHPDEADVPSLGRAVAIVGHGNVAMDVARLVARDAADFDGTDVDDAVHHALASDVREVHLVGRSAPGAARFDPVMVRELATLAGVEHVVHDVDLDAVPEGKDARMDAVRALAARSAAAVGDVRVRIHWWFAATPVEVLGADAVEGLRVATPAGERVLDASSVVTAIGFAAGDGCLVEPGAHADGRVEPGLYVAGWLRRGPRGTIPDQRADAKGLAALVLDDLSSGAVAIGRPGIDAFEGATDFDGWRRIDAAETLAAAPGRRRAKLRTLDALRAAAADASIALPEITAVADAGAGDGVPVTILFGTESGGAELIAEDLAQHLSARADVRVVDLADADPDALDASRIHLVVCSTYGDGEVPTAARPFHEALVAGVGGLDGLRYAVFGMGDKSYVKTYSRGSELVDEALAARGATRVGEYGRHDASGPLDVGDVAREWADGVLADAVAAVS